MRRTFVAGVASAALALTGCQSGVNGLAFLVTGPAPAVPDHPTGAQCDDLLRWPAPHYECIRHMHADQAAAKEKDRAEWLAILDKRIKENEAREAQEDAEAKARMTPAEYKKFAEARKQAKDRAAENRLRQMEVEDGVAADKQHAIDAVNVCGLLSGDLWVKCIIRASDVQVRSQA